MEPMTLGSPVGSPITNPTTSLPPPPTTSGANAFLPAYLMGDTSVSYDSLYFLQISRFNLVMDTD